MIDPRLIAKARKDFRVFLWVIFKHFLWDVMKDPTNVQYDIAAFLSMHRATHKIIMAFRGIGKSYITALYCVWRLWRDPTLSILIVSASKERADQTATFIFRIFADVPFLNHLHPEHNKKRGARTSKMSFDVMGAGNKQSPSVRSVGILGQLAGSRADIILADDVEIPNNSDTPLKRAKLRLAIEEFSAILRTGEGKEILFLGTPQSQESIYFDLPVGGEYGFNLRIWPAEFPEDLATHRFYGKRLAPSIQKRIKEEGLVDLAGFNTDDRFNLLELEKKKAIYGRSGYALQFLLNTTLSDALKYPLKCRDGIFMDLDDEQHPEKPVWGSGDDTMLHNACQGFEGDYYFRPMQVLGEWQPYSGNVMTIDPSGRGTDETAYCVLKWGCGYLYVLDCGGVPGGFESDTLEALAKIAKKWKVNTMVPERNMGGGMFGELMRPVLRKFAPECAIPPVDQLPFQTKQKELRIIEALEPALNSHRLVFNRVLIDKDMEVHEDVGSEHEHEYRLFTQMTRVTKDRGSLRHDDRLDALAMAVSWAQRELGQDPDALMRESISKRQDEEILGSILKQPNVMRMWGGPMRPTPAPTKSTWV